MPSRRVLNVARAHGRQHHLRLASSTAGRTTSSPTRCRSTASRCGGSRRTSPRSSPSSSTRTRRSCSPRRSATRASTWSTSSAWADAAHAQGLPLIVDNTVPTPILCRRPRRTARTSSCTPPRSTSAATAPRSAASSSTPASSTGSPTPSASPGLTKPDPSYHGVVWSDALGQAAYIGRVRTVLLRNMGAALSPFNAFLFLVGPRDAAPADGAPLAQRARRGEHARGAPRRRLGQLPGPRGRRPVPRAPDRQVLKGGRYSGIVTFGLKGGRAPAGR